MKFATSYFGNRILKHVKDDMYRLRREGFDIVVHTFSEEDFEFYEGTIRQIVAVSKDADLEVWLDPWGIGGIFGGEAYSRKALTETAWSQVSSENKRLPACCPNNPGFRGFIGDWINSACATEADAIFWDEPHFLADETGLPLGCYCEHCVHLADEMRISASEFAPPDLVAGFLKWAFPLVREREKQNVLCVLPDHLQSYQQKGIKSLADSGLSNLGTDPFWFLRGETWEDCITRLSNLAISTAYYRLQSHIWIQGFKVPSGRESEITRAVVAAGHLAPDVIAIWGFDGCAAMSSVACERPDVTWQSFLKGMELVRQSVEGN